MIKKVIKIRAIVYHCMHDTLLSLEFRLLFVQQIIIENVYFIFFIVIGPLGMATPLNDKVT